MRNIITFLLSYLLMTSLVFGQGTDLASDPAYNPSGWITGTNGGSGFGAWAMTYGSSGGTFIGNSDIDTADETWGMWADEGTTDAKRIFTTPPASGDRISIKMDNSNIAGLQEVGLELQNSSDETLLKFYFIGGQSQYTLDDGAGSTLTGATYTDKGLLIEVEVTSSSTFDIKITDLHTGALTTLINRNMISAPSGQAIGKIRLFNDQAGAFGNLYFNDLSHEVGILPIELASFEATKRTDAVELNWTTLSEENNEGFYIERSTNRTDFEQIHFEKGNGNTVEQVDYSFTDERPLDGVNYYRLKQIDFDGAFEYSDIVSVDFKGQATINLFPNPSTDMLTITGDFSELVTLKIVDLNGKVLHQSDQFFAEQADINLDAIPSGSYFLQVISTKKQSTLSTMSFVKR